ncbi:MAG: hypothetical protein LC774_10460 [Acidobacteria bacterium]|nr:hypothetical protein [Acidobacteriota bacterium]
MPPLPRTASARCPVPASAARSRSAEGGGARSVAAVGDSLRHSENQPRLARSHTRTPINTAERARDAVRRDHHHVAATDASSTKSGTHTAAFFQGARLTACPATPRACASKSARKSARAASDARASAQRAATARPVCRAVTPPRAAAPTPKPASTLTAKESSRRCRPGTRNLLMKGRW